MELGRFLTVLFVAVSTASPLPTYTPNFVLQNQILPDTYDGYYLLVPLRKGVEVQDVISQLGDNIDGPLIPVFIGGNTMNDVEEEADVSQNEDDADGKIVPLSVKDLTQDESKLRVRRQANIDVKVNRDGDTGTSTLAASAQGNLLNRGPHSLDGNVHWSRTYGPQGAESPAYGGGVTYSYSDRAKVGLDVTRQNPFGTQVSANTQGTLWRSKDGLTSLDANAHWSRSYGPWGNSRPSYGGMFRLTRMF